MKIGHVALEGAGYLLGIVLSLGPSQLYGLVKGSVDFVKRVQTSAKLDNYKDFNKKIDSDITFKDIKETRIFKKFSVAKGINEELINQNPELVRGQLHDYIEAKMDRNEDKLASNSSSLRTDAAALIPLVGAIVSWKIGRPEIGSGSAIGAEYATADVLSNHKKQLQRLLYPLTGNSEEHRPISPAYRVEIDVKTRTKDRKVEAHYQKAEGNKDSDPTVVLFHGNGMQASDMAFSAQYFLDKGYNVLMPTMGGYPAADGCSNDTKTSEATSYQDVEAVKLFLQDKGVTQVGYYGLSIGGTLAFQAAAGESSADKLQPLFVVADQTFTTGPEVAANLLTNVAGSALAPIARGAMRAALPEEKVELPGGKSIQTDGLNNRKKAAIIAKNKIPLLVLQSTQDFLMGNKLQKGGANYEKNFGEDLLKAYNYQALPEEEKEVPSDLIKLPGEHCYPFQFERSAINKFDSFLSLISPTR